MGLPVKLLFIMALTQSKKKKIEELLGDVSAEDIADFFAEQSEISMTEVIEKRLMDQQEDLGSDDVEDESSSKNEPAAAEKVEPSRSDSEMMEEPITDMDEKEAVRLFEMIMGSSFDAKSSTDQSKMEMLKKAKTENPDLSDSELALKIYREYM
tara:strand:- start:39 stop:500 length:462 start_codon:yes stop_codon:yes gene_type:complete